jgi:gag-polypeptide of LTR copia-type/Zinc knuckle
VRESHLVDPHGNAAQAIKMLNGHFNIKSVAMAQKLLNEYHEKELKNGQDLAVFVVAMQMLRLKIADADKTQKIEDRAFILRILNKLPESYETTVELIKNDINSGKMLTVDLVLEKLVLHFQCIQGSNKSGGSNGGNGKSGEDVTLYAGGFKGKCNNCGKYGHKADQCRSGSGGRGGRGGCGDQSGGRGGSAGHGSGANGSGSNQANHNANVVCNYCKEKGHMKYLCPKLELKNGGGNSSGACQGQGQGSSGVSLATLSFCLVVLLSGRVNNSSRSRSQVLKPSMSLYWKRQKKSSLLPQYSNRLASR